MTNRIRTQAAWKKLLAVALILVVGSGFAACKKSKIPSKKEIYDQVMTGQHQIPAEENAYTYEELCKSWGDPDVERVVAETGAKYKAWTYKDHFIYAVLSRDNESAVWGYSVSVSAKMVYLKQDENRVFFGMMQDNIYEPLGCIGFDLDRFASGELAGASFGDLFSMEYNGAVFQSYPGIIDVFFSFTPDGQKADEKALSLAQQELERLTVEQSPALTKSSTAIKSNADVTLRADDLQNGKLYTTLENSGKIAYGYGQEFFLDYCHDFIWYSIAPSTDVSYESMLYKIEPGTNMQLLFNLGIYGELAPGHYRILKEIVYLNEDGDPDYENTFWIAAEFDL